MEFSYHDYWVQLFVWTVIFLLVPVALFCAELYGIVKTMAEKKAIKYILHFILCSMVVVGLWIPNYKTLMNGGIYLLEEKEADVVARTGYIDNIQKKSKRIPGYKDTVKSAYGADITIDGTQYFAATSGDFQMGDRVVISYLPKSHIIMSMYAAPEKEAEENPKNK